MSVCGSLSLAGEEEIFAEPIPVDPLKEGGKFSSSSLVILPDESSPLS